jgi:predicted RNA-binding protein with EMAP domain
MNEVEKYAKQIADQINNVKYIYIDNRQLEERDINKLTKKQVVKIRHKKGFDVSIRKHYIIEAFLNIPTLLYSNDKYMIADDLMGVHPVDFNVEDTVVYVNGLLGYGDDDEEEE